jgi:hypothetical protein
MKTLILLWLALSWLALLCSCQLPTPDGPAATLDDGLARELLSANLHSNGIRPEDYAVKLIDSKVRRLEDGGWLFFNNYHVEKRGSDLAFEVQVGIVSHQTDKPKLN